MASDRKRADRIGAGRKDADRPVTRRWLSRVDAGGRVVVPAELRAALGLKPGDAVVFERERTAVVLKPQSEIVRALQSKYQQLWKAQEFSADGFLADRKATWGEE